MPDSRPIVIKIIFVVILAVITLGIFFLVKNKPAVAPVTNNLIEVDLPLPNDMISSPLKVSGQARGYWFFEASFPARLIDANGAEIAVTTVQSQGEWMTENFVPFEAQLSYLTPKTKTGILILEKDNPSGLPQNAAEVRIPVVFKDVLKP